MKASDVQEALLQLYLRLNGYFTTGFVVQAPEWGRNKAQVDALAIRHPFSREPERTVDVSPFLGLSGHVPDVLICEVKSKGMPLQFNRGLRTIDAVTTVLRWVGLFPEENLRPHAGELLKLMQPGCPAKLAASGMTMNGIARIRPLLCAPERATARSNQPWFLPGSVVFSWITTCFNPPNPRESCATQYDFSSWGPWLEPVVRYFKHLPPGNPGTIADLYKAVLD
jgi:hypothetical protein